MNKQAIEANVLRGVLGALAGGAAGAGLGYQVMPRLGGYSDVESARRGSGLMHGATGAVLGGTFGALGGRGALAEMPKAFKWGLGPTVAAEEVIPMVLATQKRTQEAQQSAGRNSIPSSLSRFAASGTGRGLGAGIGVAGLAALASGLLRRQNDQEFKERRTRGSMVGHDFLKYLVPALLAGGVMGSMSNRDSE